MRTLHINGRAVTIDVEDDTPLLWVIRDASASPARSSAAASACAAPAPCTSAEGGALLRHAAGQRRRRPRSRQSKGSIRRARIRCRRPGSSCRCPQCGYCQSGQIMQAAAVLKDNPDVTRRGHRRSHDRQPLPLHDLHAHPRRGPPGRRRDEGGLTMARLAQARTRRAALAPRLPGRRRPERRRIRLPDAGPAETNAARRRYKRAFEPTIGIDRRRRHRHRQHHPRRDGPACGHVARPHPRRRARGRWENVRIDPRRQRSQMGPDGHRRKLVRLADLSALQPGRRSRTRRADRGGRQALGVPATDARRAAARLSAGERRSPMPISSAAAISSHLHRRGTGADAGQARRRPQLIGKPVPRRSTSPRRPTARRSTASTPRSRGWSMRGPSCRRRATARKVRHNQRYRGARRRKGYISSIALKDPSNTVPGWVMVFADSYPAAKRAAEARQGRLDRAAKRRTSPRRTCRTTPPS